MQQVHASELNKAIARLSIPISMRIFRQFPSSVCIGYGLSDPSEYAGLPAHDAGRDFSDNLLFSVNKSEETNEEN